jgi:hypothetical protein
VNRIFQRDRDQHVHVIQLQMALLDPAFPLRSQLVKDLPTVSSGESSRSNVSLDASAPLRRVKSLPSASISQSPGRARRLLQRTGFPLLTEMHCDASIFTGGHFI